MISVWEASSFYRDREFIIIGAGFMGLWTALKLSEKYPGADILVLERGSIPTGASTRNAGFVCFGSLTELMEDAQLYGEEAMLQTCYKRYAGIRKIREFAQKHSIDLEISGGYELIDNDPFFIQEDIREAITRMNNLLKSFAGVSCYELADNKIPVFGFHSFRHLIYNRQEGTVHPGKLVQALMKACAERGVEFLFDAEVVQFSESSEGVEVIMKDEVRIRTDKLFICTNAFSGKFVNDVELYPARGQVLYAMTKHPVKFKGSFHYNRGFYYFRDYNGGVVLGGARNIAVVEETTQAFGLTDTIQHELENFLKRIIPGEEFSVVQRWSGIMAMGDTKTPVVKKISESISAGIRLSGIGVAVSPVLAEELINL
jgi:gamma-glutamylputrescine oxidase